jgi:hypothetical protein
MLEVVLAGDAYALSTTRKPKSARARRRRPRPLKDMIRYLYKRGATGSRRPPRPIRCSPTTRAPPSIRRPSSPTMAPRLPVAKSARKPELPELMGPTLWYVIRLAQYADLTPELIIRCGGELLERMKLPRGLVDMALFAHARDNKHAFDFGDVKQ